MQSKSLSVSGGGGRKGELILQSGEHQAEAEDRKRKSPALKDATHNRYMELLGLKDDPEIWTHTATKSMRKGTN